MWWQDIPYDPELPLIDFKEGILKLTGRCIPMNPEITLPPLFHAIYNYLDKGNPLTIIFKFDAINSTSSKRFIDFFVRVNEYLWKSEKKRKNRKFEFFWFYPSDDELMEQLGSYFKECNEREAKIHKYRKINFKLKEYNYD